MQKLLYKKREAANLLEISESTLDRLRKLGLIQSKKVGGQIMFTSSELTRFIDE